MKLKEHFKDFRIDQLAKQVITPTGIEGMNLHTLYTYMYRPAEKCPQWLLNELRRITGREIKL